VRWALWQPYSPFELRFAIAMVLSGADPDEPRIEVRAPCAISAALESSHRASSGQLTDLSPGGAFVRLDHPYPEGTPIEVSASLSGRPARLRARVAWRSGAHTPGWCDTGVGIAFEGLGLDTLALVHSQVQTSLDRFRICPRAAA
jgi:hypothetical protein